MEYCKCHIKDCFKINGKQRIIMPVMHKKGEFIKFKNYDRKIKSSFIVYVDFESILVPGLMKSKIQKSFIQANIKYILLAVMDIN